MSSLIELEGVAHKKLILNTILSGLMVLEYAWNVRFEVQVIWPQFWKNAEAKIFMMARYVGIVGQILDVWLVNRMVSGTATHPSACKAMYSYHVVIIQCLLMSVELLLMLRAWQMYNNDIYVLGILAVLIGAQWTGMAMTARVVIPDVDYSSTCILVSPHLGQIYTGASTIAVHLCLLIVILWRYFRGNWPESLRPYLKITVRDSTCTVIAVTCSFLLVTLTPLGITQSQATVNLAFQIILSSVWFAAGRLVLDKEKFRQQSMMDHQLTEVDLDNLEPSNSTDVAGRNP